MRIFAINPLQDTYINAKNNAILITMSFIHNVNIVGGRNADPAILKTRFEPMKLEDNMGISAKFIAFGEIANITGSDCQFQFLDSHGTKKVTLKIPEARYVMKEDVLLEIHNTINQYIMSQPIYVLSNAFAPDKCSTDSSFGKITIIPPNHITILVNDDQRIWSLINAHKTDDEVWVFSGELEERTGMAFVYMNIVENSYINGKKSRVLTAFPVTSTSGYTYHEFINSTYIPIEVKEFSEIEIELRDVRGSLLKINNTYDTIISMHISSINRSK